MIIENLISDYNVWLDDIVQSRLDNEELGRTWLYYDLGYDKALTTAEYQTFFDRTKQNDEYLKRYNNRNVPSKLPHSWYQNEVNMIYSFHKCFAMRNNTRLQYYRHDLSQKGARNPTTINTAVGMFLYHRELAEKPIPD